jgi:hypothetical protein
VIATAGKYKGVSILQEEQKAGLAFARSLTAEQKQKAVLATGKTGNNNNGEAFKDNAVVPYAGLPVKEMSGEQKKQLLSLAKMYIDNMDAGHAKVKMAEIEKYLDRTWFAWTGEMNDNSVFYYRIHSPVILIEFDHQLPAGLRHIAANPKAPDPQHIHVVIRTPNGNDYGKDLLRQHLAKHHAR